MVGKPREIVSLKDYVAGENNVYHLKWFMLLTYHKNRVVIYGVGQWVLHMNDYRGSNMYHGRLPKSPTFDSVEEAKDWLNYQVSNGVYYKGIELGGHHAGETYCTRGCDDRKIEDIYMPADGEREDFVR